MTWGRERARGRGGKAAAGWLMASVLIAGAAPSLGAVADAGLAQSTEPATRGLLEGGSEDRAVPERTVASCRPSDLAETALQGQVPYVDRISGRAAQGYRCNLRLVGKFEGPSFANLESYRDCVYFSNNKGGITSNSGVVVLDVSNPAAPEQTDFLTARAMGNPGESLRVNQRRGLLVANHYNNGLPLEDAELRRSLAVYDVSKDCRHPKLLADVLMPVGEGHEGCFQPDGMVYYMASPALGITPIDLSNPRRPRQLSDPWPLGVHGCTISADGKTGYFADIGTLESSPYNGVVIVNTEQVQARKKNASYKVLGYHPTPINIGQHGAYPLKYGSRTFVFNWSENLPNEVPCQNGVSNTGYATFIRVLKDFEMKEVSRMQTEAMLPENCLKVLADKGPQTQGLDELDAFNVVLGARFMYDNHLCRPDRFDQPTIMACANFGSGLRIWDIRKPRKPREIAYYNVGTVSAVDPTIEMAVAPPVVRRDLGMVFWATLTEGFKIAKFARGVWPFRGEDPCPSATDPWARQYDHDYGKCRRQRDDAARSPRP